jgi:hypothetical protein
VCRSSRSPRRRGGVGRRQIRSVGDPQTERRIRSGCLATVFSAAAIVDEGASASAAERREVETKSRGPTTVSVEAGLDNLAYFFRCSEPLLSPAVVAAQLSPGRDGTSSRCSATERRRLETAPAGQGNAEDSAPESWQSAGHLRGAPSQVPGARCRLRRLTPSPPGPHEIGHCPGLPGNDRVGAGPNRQAGRER